MEGPIVRPESTMTRSPTFLFLLACLCASLAVLLIYTMPHGPPPRQPDGSISIATMEQYDRHSWKVPWLFGSCLCSIVFLLWAGWSWLHQRKEKHVNSVRD